MNHKYTRVEQFNKIWENTAGQAKITKFQNGEYVGCSLEHFQCEEHSGFVETSHGDIGAQIRTVNYSDFILYEYVTEAFGPSGKGHFDTVQYIHYINSRTITRKTNTFNTETNERIYNEFILDVVDEISFTYIGNDYEIMKITGKIESGCITTFISSFYGIFKEYVKSEFYSHQRGSFGTCDNQLYLAHLRAMYENYKFHQRCDKGPIWLFPTNYLQSDKPRCTIYTWPEN